MAQYHAEKSIDGYLYSKQDGLSRGLKTYALIKPESNFRSGHDDQVCDAIVIGAGYAGLIAARDLVKAGMYPQEQ